MRFVKQLLRKRRVSAKVAKRRQYLSAYYLCKRHLADSDTVRYSYDRHNLSPYDMGYLDCMHRKDPNPSKAWN